MCDNYPLLLNSVNILGSGGWNEIIKDKNVQQIQIVTNPTTRSSNLIFYAAGNNEFVAKMKEAGKTPIVANQGTNLFEIHNGSVRIIEIRNESTNILGSGGWNEIIKDKNVQQIQIVTNPTTSSSNLIFYAAGNNEFVAKMKEAGKTPIVS